VERVDLIALGPRKFPEWSRDALVAVGQTPKAS